MIGISIATKWEYEASLEYFSIKDNERFGYPYGEYFIRTIDDTELVFYSTGVRKVNGVGGNQYMISKFNLTKVIVAGTCAGIDGQSKKMLKALRFALLFRLLIYMRFSMFFNFCTPKENPLETKHSLLSRADLTPIRVNVVSPCIVDTPLYGGMPDEQRQN